MQKINLEEILKSYLTVETMRVNNPDYTFNMVLSAMKDACKQTLELAAENAKINWIENEVKVESDSDFTFRASDGNWCEIILDKRTILNTIKQVE